MKRFSFALIALLAALASSPLAGVMNSDWFATDQNTAPSATSADVGTLKNPSVQYPFFNSNPAISTDEAIEDAAYSALLVMPLAGQFADVIAMGLAADVGTTLDQLTVAANRAAQSVGSGSGPVYGTQVHSAFQAEVDALGNANLATEQSYLNGSLVTRGTPGSVRLDVVEGSLDSPSAIYDLKTGSANLTPARIQQIQSQIPGGSSVPIIPIRP